MTYVMNTPDDDVTYRVHGAPAVLAGADVEAGHLMSNLDGSQRALQVQRSCSRLRERIETALEFAHQQTPNNHLNKTLSGMLGAVDALSDACRRDDPTQGVVDALDVLLNGFPDERAGG